MSDVLNLGLNNQLMAWNEVIALAQATNATLCWPMVHRDFFQGPQSLRPADALFDLPAMASCIKREFGVVLPPIDVPSEDQ